MDTWGRAEGFLVMTIFATLGLILMASCDSFPIYCAAVVFYSIGFGGMEYAIDVIVSLSLFPLTPCITSNRLFFPPLDCRYDQTEEPRSSLRLYLLSLHYHRLCWS